MISQEQVWDVERTIKASAIIVAAALLLGQNDEDVSPADAVEQAQDLWKLAIQ